jgi:hypothetical protein
MRLALCVGLAVIASGCEREPPAQLNQDAMRRPSPVADCTADLRERGRPTDRPIELEQNLRSELTKQLGEQDIRAPLCWYEVPGGDLLLRATSVCGGPMEFQFHKGAADWQVARINVYACDQDK